MITILFSNFNRGPLAKLLCNARGALPIRLQSYESLFRRLSVPCGPVIFTDFEFLSGFEMDAAATLARAVRAAGQPVLNDPALASDRYAVLRRLHAAGLNPVEILRLDEGRLPSVWPVFLRSEDGCFGPETPLLPDARAFQAAQDGLVARGLSRKRRVSVSFHAERDAAGYFRKYGAFRIGPRIVPQHILRATDWVVKSRAKDVDTAFAEEERRYVEENPHGPLLMPLFQAAGVEFGRMDYTLIGGRVVVFEINLNPTFPNFAGPQNARSARRAALFDAVRAGFAAIDAAGGGGGGPIRFVPAAATGRYLMTRRWSGPGRLVWRLRVALRRRAGMS